MACYKLRHASGCQTSCEACKERLSVLAAAKAYPGRLGTGEGTALDGGHEPSRSTSPLACLPPPPLAGGGSSTTLWFAPGARHDSCVSGHRRWVGSPPHAAAEPPAPPPTTEGAKPIDCRLFAAGIAFFSIRLYNFSGMPYGEGDDGRPPLHESPWTALFFCIPSRALLMTAANTFKVIRMGDILGGVEAISARIPCAPAVYAFYRRLDVSADVDPEEFVAHIQGEVSCPAAPLREARVGGLHRVGLHSESTLSESKLELLRALAVGKEFRSALSSIIQHPCLLQPPLYVGKAANLQTRTRRHLDVSSPLSERLRDVGIDIKKANMVYTLIPQDNISDEDQEENEAALLIEEIVTRICRPGFVLRIG